MNVFGKIVFSAKWELCFWLALDRMYPLFRLLLGTFAVNMWWKNLLLFGFYFVAWRLFFTGVLDHNTFSVRFFPAQSSPTVLYCFGYGRARRVPLLQPFHLCANKKESLRISQWARPGPMFAFAVCQPVYPGLSVLSAVVPLGHAYSSQRDITAWLICTWSLRPWRASRLP